MRVGTLEGVAHRADFDLKAHATHCGKGDKMRYFDQEKNERYFPHVIEPSAGADRGTLALLCEAYTPDPSRASGVYMNFAPRMAPVKAGVFPLVNKDGLPEIAERLYRDLRRKHNVEFDEKQSIGKRYARMDEAAAIARAAAAQIKVGDPRAADTVIGPVVSKVQFDKIQKLLEQGVAEGARLEIGGPGRPEGLNRGYYIRPTVFSHVRNDMTIAREEIFGPVLSLIGYEDDEDAIRIANDTVYGLSGYVSSGDPERAKRVARRLRTGNVHLNGAPVDNKAPFGGYKQSGNGREWGIYGLEEFLEVKAIMGYNAA